MAIPERINDNTSRAHALIAIRAKDVAHMAWVAAEVESEHALHVWFDTGIAEDAAAYGAYRATVDREEVAARDLQRLSDLTRPCQEWLAQSD